MNTQCKTFLQQVIHALNEYQDQTPEPLRVARSFRDVDNLVSTMARVVCNVKTTDDFDASLPVLLSPVAKVQGQVQEEEAYDEQVFLECLEKEERQMIKEDKCEALGYPSLEEFGVLRNRPLTSVHLPLFLTKDDIHNVVHHELKSFYKQMHHNKQNVASIKTFIRLLTRLNISWGYKNGNKLPQVKDTIERALGHLASWCEKMGKRCPKVPSTYLDHLKYYVQQLQLDVEQEYLKMVQECCGKSPRPTLQQQHASSDAEGISDSDRGSDEILSRTVLPLTHPDSVANVVSLTVPEPAGELVRSDAPDVSVEKGHVSTLQELAMAYSQEQEQDNNTTVAGGAKKRLSIEVSSVDGSARLKVARNI